MENEKQKQEKEEWLQTIASEVGVGEDEAKKLIKEYDDFLQNLPQEETKSSVSQLADHPTVKKVVDWLSKDDNSVKLKKVLTDFEGKLKDEIEENKLMSKEYSDLETEYVKKNDDCDKQLKAVIELKEKIT